MPPVKKAPAKTAPAKTASTKTASAKTALAKTARVGIIYGTESSFPNALVERINAKKVADICAEHVRLGGVKMAEPSRYAVLIDRISQDIAFYRAYLKNAALAGAIIINNPFWWSADDKFFHYSLASMLGVAVPKTAILPQKAHPPGTSAQSMRNLLFPLNWEEIFDYVGFPAFLKPSSGGSWKNIYEVHSSQDFFRAYDQTGSLCMMLQAAVRAQAYFRCCVVGQEKVRVMPYDPKQPQHLRYTKNGEPPSPALHTRMAADSLTLCRALGYDLNTVEFAIENDVPYAIDSLNPSADADLHSVGEINFEWIVENVAQLAIDKALARPEHAAPLQWDRFLGVSRATVARPKTTAAAG